MEYFNRAREFRVLLVDDDEEDFLLIRDMIKELVGKPIRLDWVESYDLAQDSIRASKYDAYLIDYRLGARTGLELIKDVSEKAQSSSPIILLTGFGDHDIDLKAMQSGAADYLVKSQLSGPLLERSIRYAINRAQSVVELKKGEERIRNLFNATFEGILVLGPDGTILDANLTAAQIFSTTTDRLIGSRFSQLLDSEIGSELDSNAAISTQQQVIEAAKSSEHRMLKVISTDENGKTIHLEISAKPYTYKGGEAALVACRDVSDRMNMEAQILMQDRLASIGLLASSLAHEIGTPLGVMRGRAEIILMQPEANELITKNANIIIGQIDRISALIRSLLNLARGDTTGVARPVKLKKVIDEVLELIGYELAKKNIKTEIKIDSELTVQAEMAALHQVILNLLVNSIHAIESAIKTGRKEDHLLRVTAEVEKDRTLVHIQDTGCGISPANFKNLFKPFFTTKEIGKGTGLGLVTSYRILESWNGSITAESQENAGSKFSLVFCNLPTGD